MGELNNCSPPGPKSFSGIIKPIPIPQSVFIRPDRPWVSWTWATQLPKGPAVGQPPQFPIFAKIIVISIRIK
jgi:hypothetical protein